MAIGLLPHQRAQHLLAGQRPRSEPASDEARGSGDGNAADEHLSPPAARREQVAQSSTRPETPKELPTNQVRWRHPARPGASSSQRAHRRVPVVPSPKCPARLDAAQDRRGAITWKRSANHQAPTQAPSASTPRPRRRAPAAAAPPCPPTWTLAGRPSIAISFTETVRSCLSSVEPPRGLILAPGLPGGCNRNGTPARAHVPPSACGRCRAGRGERSGASRPFAPASRAADRGIVPAVSPRLKLRDLLAFARPPRQRLLLRRAGRRG